VLELGEAVNRLCLSATKLFSAKKHDGITEKLFQN
jgi:hypothetical protein